MSATATTAPATGEASQLRRLYLARFAFAIAWAGVFALVGDPYDGLGLAVAAVYPLVDAAASFVALRRTAGSSVVLAANAVLSLVAAVAIVAVGSDELARLMVVWGAWAIVSGALQLAEALARRAVGGQGSLVVSGGLSVLAGAGFVFSADGATSPLGLAGYATLGGIFFLVAALRLGGTRPLRP
jgi:uncharacterized membrane protein HdeD (DUF308 family)